MVPARAEGVRVSRRRAISLIFTASCTKLGADIKPTIPPERRRYPDPATEFEVHRLTDPAQSSFLPPNTGRAVTRRGNLLIYASDRTGNLQAYAMDLKSFASTQITEAEMLRRETLTLTPDERWICYADGDTLWTVQTNGSRARQVYSAAAGWRLDDALAITADGPAALVAETGEAGNALRMVPLGKGNPSTVFETPGPIGELQPRQQRAAVLYRGAGDSLWLAELPSGRQIRLKTAGPTGPARWNPDGRTIVYLTLPQLAGETSSLRELTPDTGEDKLIGLTSQFHEFTMNGDASVFLGASRSAAAPYMLLLLRVARRELTLCEHRNSGAVRIEPTFAPDSQRIYFVSDRHGKPAIYSMAVDKLVEKTDT